MTLIDFVGALGREDACSQLGFSRFWLPSIRCDALPDEINAKKAILHGEFVVLDGSGKARFYGLMANRGTVVFAAFVDVVERTRHARSAVART